MSSITLVGILNITPDSFSDGGKYYQNTAVALSRISEMLSQGADWIDIGGESTRPGSDSVSDAEQIRRVVPIISAARAELGSHFPISVDTNSSVVADAALAAGATIVNALNGFSTDPELLTVVAKYSCRCIVYHIRGVPKSMQEGDIVYDSVLEDIGSFFRRQICYIEQRGLNANQLILDPGIGFGKTVEHNLHILSNLDAFTSFGLPLLVGVSRKGHLGTLLEKKLSLPSTPAPTERLGAALAETAIAIQNGARIVRTHDVLETKKFVAVLEEFI